MQSLMPLLMKNFFCLLIGFLALLNFTQAQHAKSDISLPILIKPSYFDISPPLRDMFQDPNAGNDVSWKDGAVKNHQYPEELLPKNYPDAIKNDPNVQFRFGMIKPDTTSMNFDGVGANNGVFPPDPAGDVGPNHYVQVVNLKYAIYDKSGVRILGPFNTDQIWNGMPNNSNDGDGIVLYDEEADRWLISQFSLPNWPNVNPSFEMVAVSQTNDPTGSWYRYQYTFTDMPDYPKFGVWRDAYYLCVNRFTRTAYLGPGAAALDRAKMLVGDTTASMIYFKISNPGYYHGLPADCDGAFAPELTPGIFAWTTTSKMIFYEFHPDWDSTTHSTFTQSLQLNITPFTYFDHGAGVPQKGTNVQIDPLSYPGSIMNRLQFRKFADHWSLVTNSTVDAGNQVAGIRWYEFRKSGTSPWSVYQQATYAPDDGNSRWCGSIAMDSSGNIGLAYSISSPDMYPSIRYTGRMSGDPLNQFTIAEAGIMNGKGSQTNTQSYPGRWGDYSTLTIDPSATSTFWYTNEYYSTTSNSSWKTRIASFSFADIFNVNVTASPSMICSGQSSQLNAAATGGSGTYTFSWSSIPAGFSSAQQKPTVIPLVTTQYIVAVNDGTTVKNDTVLVNVTHLPTSDAGADATYPNTTPSFPVTGTATSDRTVKWLTAGDGFFSIDTVPSTLYYPGPLDKNNGGVDLTFMAFPVGVCPAPASDAVHITLTFPAGIEDNSPAIFGVTLLPNPANGTFSIVIHGIRNAETRITISELTGKEIYHENGIFSTNSLTREINMTEYPKGIYIVKVHTNQQSVTKKMVLQ
jgi:hypothetical protein